MVFYTTRFMHVLIIACYTRRRVGYLIRSKFVVRQNGKEMHIVAKQGIKRVKNLASKSLLYIPWKPRIQRFVMSTKTSTLMTWLKDEKVDYKIMRHLVDSMAWNSFDELYPIFVVEPINVWLGLSYDGFQPLWNSKKSHSIWSVLLIPYN